MMSTTWLDGVDSVAHVRHIEEDNQEMIVLDFGPGNSDITCDVLDDTIIIIDGSGEQYELAMPWSVSRTFMKNGVLTIEVKE